MSKIDAAILEALAKAMTLSERELNASAGTESEHICWAKTNFIKHFTKDVFFLNNHSEDDNFPRRYGNLIIRDMLEQLIEFLYLLKNHHLAEEYLGLTINFDEVNRKTSLVNKEKLFGNERYNRESAGRPSVADMAKDIGEKRSADGSLTLYKLYQILSERCHNAYFHSLLDDINKVNSSIPASGLDGGQINAILIMATIVLTEYRYDVKKSRN